MHIYPYSPFRFLNFLFIYSCINEFNYVVNNLIVYKQ